MRLKVDGVTPPKLKPLASRCAPQAETEWTTAATAKGDPGQGQGA